MTDLKKQENENSVDYNFKMLDISEAKFIELKDLFLKLFTDNINMSNEEVNRFKKILEDNEINDNFIDLLLSNRTEAKLSDKVFEILTDLYKFSLDILFKSKNEEKYQSAILIPQTYYTMNNNNKIFLINKVKDHDIFKDANFWIDLGNLSIKENVNRLCMGNDDITEQKIKNGIAEWYSSLVLSLEEALKGVGENNNQFKEEIFKKIREKNSI